jgi:hypothetical protein
VTTSLQTFRLIAAFAMFTMSLPPHAADTFPEAARVLAEKVTAAIAPLSQFELSFRNLSSLDPEQAAEAWKMVQDEFRSRGISLAPAPDAPAKVRITLSENPQDYIWVAEIVRSDAREQLMVVQTRPAEVEAPGTTPRMAIRAELVFEAEDPILDLAFQDAGLLVLGPRHLSLCHRLNDRWNPAQAAAVPDSRPLPRDIRGRLTVQGTSIHAYLPGLACSGTASPDFTLECMQSDTPWPLESGPAKFESSRNYFVQVDRPPFFSSAAVRENGGPLWIFAGTDGRVRLYDRALQPAGTIPGWGSDMAGVDSGCGARRQVFVALPRDPSERGAVQAFEIVRRQAVAVTAPVEFPGPITALWPLSSGDSAVAVTRDVRTGRYAAYHLSIACSR